MNRKGITTIELLICFVIVIVITMSMFSVVSSYNERRITESYKAEILTYKNTLTKDIQDDLIKIGITGATYERTMTNAEGTSLPVKAVYTVNIDLRDGTKRQLVVEQTLSKSSYHPAGNPNVNDQFMIKYGDPNALTEYPLPELGSYEDETTHKTIQDFSINNVLINIYDEKVLSIYIGFYHPELGTRYCIEITALIDFTFTGAEFVDPKKIHYYISYNLMGGSVTPKNPISYDGKKLPLPLTDPTKPNSTFEGWTGSNGTEKQKGYSIPVGTSGNLSYTANFRPNICTITFSPNGGSFTSHTTDTTQSCDYHDTDKCTNDMRNADGGYYSATRTGYSIVSGKEWKLAGRAKTFNQANGYKATDFCSNLSAGDQNVTLNVNWDPIPYTITYDDAYTHSNPTTYNIESPTITLTDASRTHYEFLGWTGPNGSTPQKGVQIPTGSYGNKKYTANWDQVVFTISYNKNLPDSVTGIPSSVTKGKNETIYISNSVPTVNGYEFLEWNSKEDGSGTSYTGGASYSANSDLTLYAQWKSVKGYFNFFYTGDFTVNGNNYSNTSYYSENLGEYVYLKTSGTFTTYTDMSIDIFAVGGGRGGTDGSYSHWYDSIWGTGENCCGNSGSGGKGGSCSIKSAQTITKNSSYSVAIGAGGSGSGGGGGTSSFGSLISAGGGTSSNTSCGGQYEFGLSSGSTKYGQDGKGDTANTGNGGTAGSGGGCGSAGFGTMYKCTYGNGKAGSTGVVVLKSRASGPIIINGTQIGTFTGGYEIVEESGNNWTVKLISNGNFNLNRAANVDIFAVGGGQAGGNATRTDWVDTVWGTGDNCCGTTGSQGIGGGCNTVTNRNIGTSVYAVTIGTAGQTSSASGGATTFSGIVTGPGGSNSTTACNNYPFGISSYGKVGVTNGGRSINTGHGGKAGAGGGCGSRGMGTMWKCSTEAGGIAGTGVIYIRNHR